MNSDLKAGASLWSIGTLVVWLVCLAASVLGGVLPYPEPRLPVETSEQLPTQIVDAELTPQPVPPAEIPIAPPDQAAPSIEPPAPTPSPPVMPAEPELTAVALPSPAISFALPTEGLTHIVDVGNAGYIGSGHSGPLGNGRGANPSTQPPPPKPAASAPAVAKLIFGEGEGLQPPPQYPREAILAHQEGTVGLRFSVGEDGRVSSVEVTSPSRWPLLNQAAIRAVRDTWRFSPGARRVYEVPIEFQLNH